MVKLLLASLLLIGTLSKLSCVTDIPDYRSSTPGLTSLAWIGSTTEEGGSTTDETTFTSTGWKLTPLPIPPEGANPLLNDHRVVNFGKLSIADHLLKQEYLYRPRKKGEKGTIKETSEFKAEDDEKINQVRLLLYNNGKAARNQAFNIRPKLLRKKPAKNAYVEVYNKKGGVLADVQVYGH